MIPDLNRTHRSNGMLHQIGLSQTGIFQQFSISRARGMSKRTIAGIDRGYDDQRGHGQHNCRINKHPDHGDRPLHMRRLYLRNGMSVRR